ncbi:MAG TPA: hypothetical protein VMV66_01510 [Candidatus Humimicrobiaceae bacterium]|nr:hypothetical protein [Candidatus Humimicrobiaceae bacterium]
MRSPVVNPQVLLLGLKPDWYISIPVIVFQPIILTIFVEIPIDPLRLLLFESPLGEKIVLAGQIDRYY